VFTVGSSCEGGSQVGPSHRSCWRRDCRAMEPAVYFARFDQPICVIATVFLPLTFITGFFGQNFDWMVTKIHSWPMFLLLGVGSEIVALLALLAFFKRRGWF
jgi:hypothetical protein